MKVRITARAKSLFNAVSPSGIALAKLYRFAHKAKTARDIIEYIAEQEGIEKVIGCFMHGYTYITSSDGFLIYYLNVGETYRPTLTVQKGNTDTVVIDFISWGDWIESKMKRGKKVYA